MGISCPGRVPACNAAAQIRDPWATYESWIPDQQRITPERNGVPRRIRGTGSRFAYQCHGRA
jgi:hypothetical protein